MNFVRGTELTLNARFGTTVNVNNLKIFLPVWLKPFIAADRASVSFSNVSNLVKLNSCSCVRCRTDRFKSETFD